MRDRIVIAGACRTPIGVMGGSLSTVPAVSMGSLVIRETLKRTGIPAAMVDHVYMGCVIQAAQGQNPARQAAVNAGIPVEVPAVTINVVCGSGLDAVNQAAYMIRAGEAQVVIAGGMENMSMAPYALMQGRYGYRMGNGQLMDTMVNDALWDAFHQYHMGVTAENVAERWQISREMQDVFALQSHRKAAAAREKGYFEQELLPVAVKKKKETVIVDRDEGIRDDTSLEKMARLKPVFKEGGTVTAANASGINDGAAAVILLSESKAEELGVVPQAYWTEGALSGVDPAIMGTGPVAAVRKVFSRTGFAMHDMDLVEANEAFAAQALAVQRELEIPEEILNVNGGAIAMGHPVGASGCRILVTLLHEMARRDVHRGLATLCIGGGMGCAVVVER